MKRHLKKYTSLKLYIEFLRKQPDHIQHIYAVIFAGSITALIAFFILYIDYGFWHERYIRDDMTIVNSGTVIESKTKVEESPSEMVFRFFGEAKDRLGHIKMPSKSTLEGTETYGEAGVESIENR